MDNKKRNVHNSGPLGMLLQTGQINKLEETPTETTENISHFSRPSPSYFKTESGIQFTEHELVFVDPKECEPWEYANRNDEEMGDMDSLVESIRLNKQLQPALIRPHPKPHDNIKYEVIFGRRRHSACLILNIPFLAIRQEISDIHEAIASQDAENKFRKDVSNYSNAVLYRKLLNDKVFLSESELAKKLKVSKQSINDLLAYTKIPDDILCLIPNVHMLSVSFVLKLVSLLKQSPKNIKKLTELAVQFGKQIKSAAQLEKSLSASDRPEKEPRALTSKQYKSKSGGKLFTFKFDQRGNPSIIFNKASVASLDFEELCGKVQQLIEQ